MKKLLLLFIVSSLLSCSKNDVEETIIIDSPILGKWQQDGFGAEPNWHSVTNGIIYEFLSDGTYKVSNSSNNYTGHYNVITGANANKSLTFYVTKERIDFTKELIFFINNIL